MPVGSSSLAPGMRPGPSARRNVRSCESVSEAAALGREAIQQRALPGEQSGVEARKGTRLPHRLRWWDREPAPEPAERPPHVAGNATRRPEVVHFDLVHRQLEVTQLAGGRLPPHALRPAAGQSIAELVSRSLNGHVYLRLVDGGGAAHAAGSAATTGEVAGA